MSSPLRGPAPAGGPPRGAGPWWTTLQVVLSASLILLFVVPILALFTYAPVAQVLAAGSDPQVRAALWLTFFASGLAVLAALVC